MSSTVFNLLPMAALGVLLSGCGLVQSVSETTTSTTRAIFYKQVNTLHLDLESRASVNSATADMNALSVPTLVRVYQLRDSKTVEKATYDELLTDADHVLGADLVNQHSVVVKPGEGAQLNVPMDKSVQAIAVVALFREPDQPSSQWRLTLRRDDLDPDRARVIELSDSSLVLRPLAKDEQ
jgi:type VI secretion system protein VasD